MLHRRSVKPLFRPGIGVGVGRGGGGNSEHADVVTVALESEVGDEDTDGFCATPESEEIDLSSAIVVEPQREPFPRPVASRYVNPRAAAAAITSPSLYAMSAAHPHVSGPFPQNPPYLTGQEHLSSALGPPLVPRVYDSTVSPGTMPWPSWCTASPFEQSPAMPAYQPYIPQPPTIPSQPPQHGTTAAPLGESQSGATGLWVSNTSGAGLGSSPSTLASCDMERGPDPRGHAAAPGMAGSSWYGGAVDPHHQPSGLYGISNFNMPGFTDYSPRVPPGPRHNLGGGMGMGFSENIKEERRE